MRAARFYDRGDIRVDEINEKGVDAAFELPLSNRALTLV